MVCSSFDPSALLCFVLRSRAYLCALELWLICLICLSWLSERPADDMKCCDVSWRSLSAACKPQQCLDMVVLSTCVITPCYKCLSSSLIVSCDTAAAGVAGFVSFDPMSHRLLYAPHALWMLLMPCGREPLVAV